MNAPADASAAQAANTSSRGRARGRGGGPAPRARTTTRQTVAKPQLSKIGPHRLLETEWVKDSILKGDCFVLFAATGKSGDQQWTFHHPIGETPLGERDWVATPTRDIGYLLQRRESEALTAWKRQSELAKRQMVLRLQRGRKLDGSGQEVWTFEGAPAIQPTIRSCMSAAKSAGANESEWLSYADRAVRVAEQQFKESLRMQTVPSVWVRENPRPAHETMGGPLGDLPQKAIPFLKGLSSAAAKDKVIRVAIGVDRADAPDSDNSDSEDEGPDEDSPLQDETLPEVKTPEKPKTPSPKGKEAQKTPQSPVRSSGSPAK